MKLKTDKCGREKGRDCERLPKKKKLEGNIGNKGGEDQADFKVEKSGVDHIWKTGKMPTMQSQESTMEGNGRYVSIES